VLQQLQLRGKLLELVKERECPLPRIKKIVPKIVKVWNGTKFGIDNVSHYVAEAAPVHKRCSAPSMLCLRDLRYRGYNAMVIWRLLEIFGDLGNYSTYKTFKEHLRQKGTFHECLAWLITEGIHKTNLPPGFVTPPSTPPTQVQSSRKRKPVSKQTNNVPGSKVRPKKLSSGKRPRFRKQRWQMKPDQGFPERNSRGGYHTMITGTMLAEMQGNKQQGDRRGKCIICKKKTNFYCADCEEFLCQSKKKRWDMQTKDCWEAWHTCPEIPVQTDEP